MRRTLGLIALAVLLLSTPALAAEGAGTTAGSSTSTAPSSSSW
jgi:hypothetical protein